MRRTEEKGITLIALVTTIFILLILVSIGINTGTETIEYAKFTDFKDELVLLQTKVNELNENDELNIGKELNESQKSIFNISEVSNIIFKNKTEDEITKIKNGFKYCNFSYLNNQMGLEGVKREYLINVEYRYIICTEGFSYEGTTYYMINQIDNEIYNVEYNNKNIKYNNESFEVTCTKETDRWKIEVTNINYDGYINNWDVKYRLGEENWKSANGLTFYVTKAGNYYVQVMHDDINLGSKLVTASD